MRLTLYVNTMLSDRYTEVFDPQCFMAYLNAHGHHVYDIPSVYLPENGSITIDYTNYAPADLPLRYNYMRIDPEPDTDMLFPRFAFIDNIDYVNGMMIINYSVDIWHTYAPNMNIRNGIVGRALRGTENLRRALPVAYETNASPRFNHGGGDDGFYLVAEMSEYLVETPEPSEASLKRGAQRQNFTAILGHVNFSATYGVSTLIPLPTEVPENSNKLFTVPQAKEAIDLLVKYQNTRSSGKTAVTSIFTTNGGRFDRVINGMILWSDTFGSDLPGDVYEDQRYEINQIYAVPRNMIDAESLETAIDAEHHDTPRYGLKFITSFSDKTDTAITTHITELSFFKFKQDSVTLTNVYQVSANPEIIGYGFRSLMIPRASNNKTTQITAMVIINDFGASFGLIDPEAGYIDVDSQLEIPMPYTTMGGTEREQAIIAKQQAKMQRNAAIVAAIATIASGIGSAYKFATNAASVGREAALESIERTSEWNEKHPNASYTIDVWGTAMKDRRRAMAKYGLQNIGGMTQGAMSGLYAMTNIVSAQNTLKSPLAMSSANNTTPNALENANLGIGYYTYQINNSNEVKDAIDKIGYTVYIPTNDYTHGMSRADLITLRYDVVQFLNAEVSGYISQSVAKQLEAILLSGCRIYYDASAVLETEV